MQAALLKKSSATNSDLSGLIGDSQEEAFSNTNDAYFRIRYAGRLSKLSGDLNSSSDGYALWLLIVHNDTYNRFRRIMPVCVIMLLPLIVEAVRSRAIGG